MSKIKHLIIQYGDIMKDIIIPCDCRTPNHTLRISKNEDGIFVTVVYGARNWRERLLIAWCSLWDNSEWHEVVIPKDKEHELAMFFSTASYSFTVTNVGRDIWKK